MIFVTRGALLFQQFFLFFFLSFTWFNILNDEKNKIRLP